MAKPREGIMLAKPFEERLFERMQKPVLVQPKLEGDRARYVVAKRTIYSSTGSVRESVPHILADLERIGDDWLSFEFDGELYRHGMPHSDIRSIVSRTVNLHPDYEKMEFHIFDIMSGVNQADRNFALDHFLSSHRFVDVKFVPYRWVRDLEELDVAYEFFLKLGYEGIIIRDPTKPYVRSAPGHTSHLLKLKPRMSESFVIVAVEKEEFVKREHRDTMGKFVLRNEYGEFKVGSGPTDRQRDLIWKYREHFPGQYCKIRFQAFTKARGVPKMQSIDKDWLTSVEKLLGGI